MSADRIIQDSDESDGDISLAPSADPLQDAPTTIEQRTRNVTPPGPSDIDDYPANTTAATDDHAGQSSANLTVNFDEFLVSQGQTEEQLSLSQQQREEQWIGGQNTAVKRSRTIGVLGEVQGQDEKQGNRVKRRRVMTMGDECDISSFEVAVPQHGLGERIVSQEDQQHNDVPPESAQHIYPSISWNGPDVQVGQNNLADGDSGNCESDVDPLTFEHGTATTQQSVPSEPFHFDTHHQPFKFNLSRSKSMLVPTDSPHDTEPMSSITYARARRTMTSGEGQPPPPSSANSVDELALPVSVQVAVNKTVSFKDRSRDADESNPPKSEDKLDSDDFGGMPKEMYKPRPSRSRRSKSIIEEQLIENGIHQEAKNQSATLSEEIPERLNEDAEACELMPDGPSKCAPPDDIQPQHVEPAVVSEIPAAPPAPKRRGPKKKKVKRGKTMSVLAKKNVDSDVEDDVIWVDERPAPKTFKGIKLPPLFEEASVKEEKKDATNALPEESVPEALDLDVSEQAIDKAETPPPEPPAPAPKKRDRKRKKTMDPVVEIPNKPLADDQIVPDQQPNTLQPPIELDQTAPSLQPQPEEHPIETEEPIIPPETQDPPDTPCTPEKMPTNNDKGANQRESPAQPQPQPDPPFETPKKPDQKGPDKHSPITVNGKINYRVGLSRKARIAPLLKVIRR